MHNMIPPLKDNQSRTWYTQVTGLFLYLFLYFGGMWKETEEPGGQKRGNPDVEIV